MPSALALQRQGNEKKDGSEAMNVVKPIVQINTGQILTTRKVN